MQFTEGWTLRRRALFAPPPNQQGSDLAADLGCNFFPDGSVEVNDFGQTTVVGVYAAGDMAGRVPFPAAQIVHAASSDSLAAAALGRELLRTETTQA